MTESIKLAELHRTNIDYERQRHLANWLIKSSPHMNKAPSAAPPINANQPPIYFVGKTTNAANHQHVVATLASNGGTPTATANGGTATAATAGAMGLSRSTLFNSQSNLPLQIMTTQEGHKPKLRRFNSHDTSANMFSVADFENARLARRNEMEIKQRQQNRYKMNSLSSGTGDCSTGDSKGSKFSSDSFTELLQADLFLDRYSLPRVVRLSTKFGAGDETIQSSSSHETFSSSGASSSLVGHTKRDTATEFSTKGELFLLFRQMKNRHIYHGVSAKSGASRKKGFMIPQEFQGYFSLINEKGSTSAMQYTTLIQLVRERVYKFLSVDNLPAYTETQNTDTYPPRPHYVKGTTRGGQVFRLLAVFEDGKQDATNGHQQTTGKSNGSAGPNAFRDKEKGRYAQLLNENRQLVYVSLTAKGKFYEIEKGTPQIFQKTISNDSNLMSGGKSVSPKPPNPDCVHRISQLLVDANVDLPVTLRYIGGPQGSTSVIPDTLTITKITTEHVLIACPIEDVEARSPLHLRKLQVAPEMQFIKSLLGFESEQKMFLSQNVQNILKFCQMNIDSFLRMIEMEHLAPTAKHNTYNGTKSKGEGLKILKPLNFPRLLRREKSTIAHEKEDSIIFLSKNDLENLDNKAQDPAEKMKVFQPTKKKWFRKSAPKSSGAGSVVPMDIDAQTKRMSMDRFQDMSKLLHERFGNDNDQFVVLKSSTSSAARPSSEIGVNPTPMSAIDQAELRQKSMSLQDMDTRSNTSYSKNRPDLVPVEVERDDESNVEQSQEASDMEDRSLISFSNQQSFISEKLYTEFHVKTKQHSKSSSHLHNLLHFSVPQKMNISETPRKKIQFDDGSMAKPDASSMVPSMNFYECSSTSIEDEMPYSSVRDSLVVEASNVPSDGSSHQRPSPYATTQIGAPRSLDLVQPENIYSEICPEVPRHEIVSVVRSAPGAFAAEPAGSTVRSSIVNGGAGSTIRISVLANSPPQSLDTVFANASATNGARDTFVMDNIYNTLQ